MKRFLLFAMMCACATIGAWAAVPDGAKALGSNGSYFLQNDATSGTIYIASADDVDGNSYWNSWSSFFTEGSTITVTVADGVDLSGKGHNQWYYFFQFEKNITVDLSGLNETNAKAFKTGWSSAWVYNPNNDNEKRVKNVIFPSVCFNEFDTYIPLGGGVNIYCSSNDKTSAKTYIGNNENFDSNLLGSTASSLSIYGTQSGSLSIDNDNLTSVDFSAINNNSLSVDVSGCSTLNKINMTGATINQLTVSNVFDGEINVTDPENITFTLYPETANQYLKGPAKIPVIFSNTTMHLHDAETGENADKTVYWYAGAERTNAVATINMTDDIDLSSLITNYLTDSYQKVKITGPLTAANLNQLASIDCEVLDLSEAVVTDEVLAAKFQTANALHTHTKFLIAPKNSTREGLINAQNLAGLTNVYSVVSTSDFTKTYKDKDGNEVGVGVNLTSYNRVAGTLQAAVAVAFPSSSATWTRGAKQVYTSDEHTFRDLVISGALNAYDLGGSTLLKVDADGHMTWNMPSLEGASEATGRALNGSNEVYGPFSSSHQISSIDLEQATFEQVTDMTLSELLIVGTATGKIVIPTSPTIKEIPANFLSGTTHIRAICIPSNIEIIRSRAFYSLDYVWTTSGTNDPEGKNTKLDNGIKYKETDETVYATQSDDFDYTKTPSEADWGSGTYTFSSNLKLIETAAFDNARPHVKDVYVLNTVAPECHVDAFNTAMYLGNGGYKSEIIDGIITRDGYRNNGTWITMLHYPRQTKTPEIQRYTDPTREYSVATGQRDGKGATLYFPNQSEFIRAYMQGTYGYTWKAWDPTRTYGSVDNTGLYGYVTDGWESAGQAVANEHYDSNGTVSVDEKKFYTFYDVSLGGNTKPETLIDYYLVQYGGGNYSVAATQGNLYPKANETNTALNEVTERDYRGWHQFVLTEYAANTTLDEEPYRSYITDNEWWTICPTFDITKAEASILFGVRPKIQISDGVPQYPYVSKLRYVRRDYSRQTIYLNFSQDLTRHKENRLNSTDKHGVYDQVWNYVSIEDEGPDESDIVMSAGVPYLIKPAISTNAYRQFRIFPNRDELQKFREQFSEEEWNNRDFLAFEHETLHRKLKEAEAKKGSDQMADVHEGIYTVPVFVSESSGSGLEKESVGTRQYKIDGINYFLSNDWKYSFVGTFYKSFMPHYCYFLGWDSSLNNGQGAARFWYHNGNFEWHDNNMNWNNETGVICPIYKKESFDFEITEAHEDSQQGTVPAQWDLKDKFVDDSFIKKSTGAPAKSYDMIIDSPEVLMENMGITTVIEGFDNYVEPELVEDIKVYNLEGQFVGNSMNGLAKGVYVVNGKKCVIR